MCLINVFQISSEMNEIWKELSEPDCPEPFCPECVVPDCPTCPTESVSPLYHTQKPSRREQLFGSHRPSNLVLITQSDSVNIHHVCAYFWSPAVLAPPQTPIEAPASENTIGNVVGLKLWLAVFRNVFMSDLSGIKTELVPSPTYSGLVYHELSMFTDLEEGTL